MPPGNPLLRQLSLRLLAVFGISVLITAAVWVWIYRGANEQATRRHLDSAREHYTGVISSLERRWGREAFNLKIRLESHRFLEDLPRQRENLLAYLTAQGGSIEFPALRIEDVHGDELLTFEYAGERPPRVHFQPGQESLWAVDATGSHLFMVFRQTIWLGKENGYLLLFRPLDHALLTQQSYPETRLSLWWRDIPIASSEGDEGLAAAVARARGAPGGAAALLWAGTDRDKSPLLVIESISSPLFSPEVLALPLLVGLLLFLLFAWLAVGRWMVSVLSRLPAPVEVPPPTGGRA